MRHFVNSFEEEKENTAAVKKAKSILKALTVGAVKQVAVASVKWPLMNINMKFERKTIKIHID